MENVLVIVLQIFLLWSVYYGIAKPKISLLAVGAFIVYFSLVFALFKIYGVTLILPYIFFYTIFTQGYQRKRLAFFYSLYTTFISLLLSNFIAIALTEFVSEATTDQFILLFLILSMVLPIALHYFALYLFKIDINILKEEDEFVTNEIIRPMNYILIICFITLLVIYGVEMYFADSIVSDFSNYVMLILLFMFLSIMGYISNKTGAYLQLQVQRSKEKQLEQLSLYTKEIEAFYQTLKGFRHDYANILISLKESIDSGEIRQIRTVYDEILLSANLKLVREAKNTNINELSNIKNLALKSVLFWKVTEAKENGVNIHIEVKDPIEDLQMDILDVVRILSILMDNAIEEAKKTPQATMNLAFLKETNHIVIIVKNSRSKTSIPIGRLFEAGFSTKGSSRGMGLYNVKKILSSYPFVDMDTEISEDSFTQRLTIRT